MNDKELLEQLGIKDIDIQTNEYLKHFGILGMKWGIRRFQPYPKGEGHKGRYKGKKENVQKIKANKAAKKDEKEKVKTTRKTPTKPSSTMSDEDLRASINRIQMERQYDQLTSVEKTKGKLLADELLVKSVKVAVAGTITREVAGLINKAIRGK